MKRSFALWGCLAAIATIIMALPTIGLYVSHVASVWRAPDQVQRIDALQSNQTQQAFEIKSIGQDVRDMRQDVRDIKLFLYNGKKQITANIKTNSIYE